MKRHLLSTALLALFAVTGSASAQELSYTYVDVDLQHIDNDSAIDTDGAAVRGSIGLPANFHLFGGASFDYGDDEGLRTINRGWYAGIGAVYPISNITHIVANVAYGNDKLEVTVDDLDGLGRLYGEVESQQTIAELGIRTVLGNRWEGWVMGRYTEVDDFEIGNIRLDGEQLVDGAVDVTDDLGGEAYGRHLRVGALFKITPAWGLTLQAQGNSDYNAFSAGVRATF